MELSEEQLKTERTKNTGKFRVAGSWTGESEEGVKYTPIH